MNRLAFQFRQITSTWLSHRYKRLLVWVCVDAYVVFIAYSAAFSVRAFSTPLDYVSSAWAFAASALVMIVMLAAFGVYRVSGVGPADMTSR